jgi:hypothetical protein
MNPLEKIMGVMEASSVWKLHPDYIKKLAQQQKVIARKIGQTWILIKDQPNPKK